MVRSWLRRCWKSSFAHGKSLGRRPTLGIEALEERIVPADWSGIIPDGTVWTNTEVQRIVGDISVPAGATLTVEPGTVVKFDLGVALTVEGTFNALGTAQATIVFTSNRDNSAGGDTDPDDEQPAGTDWAGLRFLNAAAVLDHVEVRYARNGTINDGYAVLADGGSLSLTNSVIREMAQHGLRIQNATPAVEVRDVTIGRSTIVFGGAAISMDLASNPTLRDLTLLNNLTNGVLLDSGGGFGPASLPIDAVWDDPGIPYVLPFFGLTVPEGRKLTLAPGQIVKTFGHGLFVEGTLEAHGTPAQPVLFTSLRDDSVGGDTDNDPTPPSSGNWGSVTIRPTGAAVLDQVQVRFGGSTNGANVAVDGGTLTLTNSVLRDSSRNGLRIDRSTPTVAGVTFLNNQVAAVSMDLASDATFHGNTFVNNGFNGVTLDGGELPADTVWDDPEVVYILPAAGGVGLTVPQGRTLTIRPGQIVKASPGTFTVQGRLIAQGTAEVPVIFTAAGDDSAGGDTNNDGPPEFRTFWGGIDFTDTSTGNLLDHTEFRCPSEGFGGFAVRTDGAELTMTNSVIRDGGGDGLRLQGGTATVRNTAFVNLPFNAISMDLTAQPTFVGLTFANNGTNGVMLDGGTLPGDTAWNNPEVMYHYTAFNITVPVGATLTIAPGQIIKAVASSQNGSAPDLIVHGTLSARGTREAPIIFTRNYDASAGGDSGTLHSFLGRLAIGNRIEWVNSHSDNVLEYVEHRLSFGDSFGEFFGGLTADNSTVAIRHSVIRDGWGVEATNNASVELVNNIMARNGPAILAEYGGIVTALNNTIDSEANGSFAVVAVDGGIVNLTNNLITGPTGPFDSAGVRAITGTANLSHNNVFTGLNYEGFADPTGINGNISADPRYFNAANMQYQLRPNSPALDAATSLGAPATDFLGNARFDNPTIPNSGSGSITFGDMGALERQLVLTSDIDLATSAVSGPTTATQDDLVSVSWTVSNLGTGTAVGPWFDAVYLSADSVWSPDDLLIGEQRREADLGPGQSYTASLTSPLPGALGRHFFVVRADSRNDVFEAAAERNNNAAAPEAVTASVPTLTLGTPTTAQLTQSGQQKFFKVTVPAGDGLAIDLDGPPGAQLELYAAFGALPSRQGSAAQRVTLSGVQAGDYYVLVHGTDVPEGTEFTLTASLMGFGISDVTPARGSNTGRATISIEGAQFTTASQPRLIDSAGNALAPVQVHFIDGGQLAATFDLTGRPLGAATVQVVQPGGATASLPGAFTIVAGQQGRLVVSASAPSAVRLTRSFAIHIDYINVGDTDLLAPVLSLESSGASQLSFTADLADAASALNLIAVNPNGPAGVLPPGARGRLTVYSSGVRTGDNAFSLIQGEYTNTPIDWEAVAPVLRPEGLTEEEWAPYFAQLRANLGDTWDSFHRRLAEATTLLPGAAGRNYSYTDVLLQEVDRALAQVRPSLSGQLFLGDATQPLANVPIRLFDSTLEYLYETVARTDGSFLVADILPGSYTVTFAGYVTSTPLQIVVGQSSQSNLEWIVERAGTISGSVVLASLGVPLRNVLVQATSESGFAAAFTDASGRYTLAGLPPGVYQVTAGGNPFTQVTLTDVSVNAGEGTGNINLALEVGGTISGTVLGPSGPVAGIDVVALGADGTGNATTTAADGTYTLAGLAGQLYTIRAQGVGLVSAVAAGINLPASGSVAGVGLTLTTAGSIRGTATANSVPAAAVFVQLLSVNRVTALSSTDASGAFTLTDLAPGDYLLTASSNDFQTVSTPVAVVAGVETVVPLTLAERGTISGVVRDALNQPLPAVIVYAAVGLDIVALTTTDASGAYQFAGLDAGVYQVILGDETSPGVAAETVTIDAATTNVTTDFSVSLAGKVFGTVYAADGVTPLANAAVALTQNGNVLVSMLSDEAGQYSFIVVAAGTYQLEAFAAGLGYAPLNAVTLSAGIVRTGLDFRPGVEIISGVVRDSQGNALAGAAVIVRRSGPGLAVSEVVSLTTAADGSFNFAAAATGSYRVSARAVGHAVATQGVLVSAGQPALIQLSLPVESVLSGTIRNADTSDALAGAAVILRGQDNPDIQFVTQTDATGGYRFSNLSVGSYSLVVRASNHATVVLPQLDIGAGTQWRNVALDEATIQVRGTVRSAARSLAGVVLTVRDATGLVVDTATTGADGRYELTRLSAGSYLVTAAVEGYLPSSPAPLVVAAGASADGFDVALSPVGLSDVRIENQYPRRVTTQIATAFVPRVVYNETETSSLSKAPDDEPAKIAVNSVRARVDAILAEMQRTVRATAVATEDLIELRGSLAPKLAAATAAAAAFGEIGTSFLPTAADIKSRVNNLTQLLDDLTNLDDLPVITRAVAVSTRELTGLRNVIEEAQKRLQASASGQQKDVADALGGLRKASTEIGLAKTAVEFQLQHVSKVSAYNLLNDNLDRALGELKVTLQNLKRVIPPDPEAVKTQDERIKRQQEEQERRRRESTEPLGGPVFCPSPGPPPDPNGSNLHGPNLLGFASLAGHDDHHHAHSHPEGGRCPPPEAAPLAQRLFDFLVRIVAAFDPNDKVGPAGVDAAGFIQSGTLPYTVRFENDPNLGATAAAQEVVVTDTLDEDLDLTSVEFTRFGFGAFSFDVPAGLSRYETLLDLRPDGVNLLVPVRLEVNPETRVLTATFRSLDPDTGLPPDGVDDGFLPVNDGTGRGEGFFSYTVRPLSGLPTGTEIRNRAAIVFDTNAPIVTPETLNTLDVDAPTGSVNELPNRVNSATFTVSWTGSDAGSGVAFYGVFVSTDDGPFVPFLLGTPDTSTTFEGEAGRRYAFYAIATDHVGLREVSLGVTEATTATPPAIGADAYPLTLNKALSVVAPGVLANDRAAESGPLTIELVRGPKRGKLTLNADGSFRYKPRLNAKGPDGFTYRVRDNVGALSEVATVSLLPQVRFAAAAVTKGEDITTVKIPVKLSIPSTQAVSVLFAVVGGTATNGSDYQLADGVLTIAAGKSSGKIVLRVVNDRRDEADETIQLALSSPTNALLGTQNSHTYTIRDNDPLAVLQLTELGSGVDEDALTAMAISLLLGRDEHRRR